MLYFKITNKEENHHGFQYKSGLNILEDEFAETGSCVKGGLYFTSVEHIFNYLDYGIYLREVFLPEDDPTFKMVKDPEGNKWRANKIILGNRFLLSDVNTFNLVIENVTDIHAYNELAIIWTSRKGHLEIVKFLIEKGADIHSNNNYALRWASKKGHLEIVKFLIEKGADIHSNNNYALRWASNNGHFEIVK